MRCKNDCEKATEQLACLNGPAFDLYFEKFAENDELSAAALDYGHAKRTILDALETVADYQRDIQFSVEANLTANDLPGSLTVMRSLYEKVGFNEQAKYGMMRNEMMAHTELSQFCLIRNVKYF